MKLPLVGKKRKVKFKSKYMIVKKKFKPLLAKRAMINGNA